jgi:hypothetical protein
MAWIWPGLIPLWLEGSWSGVLLAVGFAGLLNLLLLASLVWEDLLSLAWLISGWAIVASLWLVSAIWSSRNYERRQQLAQEVNADDLFRQALSEYLQGSFLAAESTLERLLKHHPHDVEARLLLATLLRHTKRHDEARSQVARLAQLEGAQRWATEIAAEREQLSGVHPLVANLFGAQPANASASRSVSRAA